MTDTDYPDPDDYRGATGTGGDTGHNPTRAPGWRLPSTPLPAGGPSHRSVPKPPGRTSRALPAAEGWTVRYALVALVVAFALGIGEALLVTAVTAAGPLRAGVAGILLDLTLLATLVPLYRRRPFGRRALGLRTAPPASSVGWVLLAVVIIGVTNLLYLRKLLHLSSRQTLGVGLHGSTIGLVLVGLFVCVSAPLTEELFFRGVLYRALRTRCNVVWAALIAGVVFGAVHGLGYPPDTLPPRAVFGVLACLLYERTGSLLPGMALHMFIDASGYEQLVSGRATIVELVFVLLAAGLLLAAGIRRMDRWSRRPVPAPVRPSSPEP